MGLESTIWSRLGVVSAVFAMCGCIGASEADVEGLESTDETDSAIIGGTPATSFPESVLVNMAKNGQIVAACSGAVIAPKVVLTAGHCVTGFTGFAITAPFASNQKATAVGAVVFDYTSTKETVEPTQHDVALIFLDKAISISQYPKLKDEAHERDQGRERRPYRRRGVLEYAALREPVGQRQRRGERRVPVRLSVERGDPVGRFGRAGFPRRVGDAYDRVRQLRGRWWAPGAGAGGSAEELHHDAGECERWVRERWVRELRLAGEGPRPPFPSGGGGFRFCGGGLPTPPTPLSLIRDKGVSPHSPYLLAPSGRGG